MIKKIIIGIIMFAIVYFLVLPWVGHFLTLVFAFVAVMVLFGLLGGKKKRNEGS